LFLAAVITGVLGYASGAGATPVTKWPGLSDKIFMVRWVKGSTIDIYVPFNTVGGEDRAKIVKDAIEGLWKPKMAEFGVTVKVTVGAPGQTDPPAGTNVVAGFVPAGDPQLRNTAGGQDAASTAIFPGPPPPGQTKGAIGAGKVLFSRSLSGNDLRNVAQHEFIHVAGLADEASGPAGQNVSDHTVPPASKQQSFSSRDLAELGTLYSAAPTGQVTDTVTALGGGLYRYSYDVVWTDGSEIPFLALPVEVGQITDVSIPSGWRLWDRTSPDEALNLQIDFQVGPPDPGLSSVVFFNPDQGLSSTFPGPAAFVFTSWLRPGTIDVLYGGDEYVSVAGPVVPEPASLSLVLTGVSILLARARYRRQVAW
jgi:hypothetical protein